MKKSLDTVCLAPTSSYMGTPSKYDGMINPQTNAWNINMLDEFF